MKNFVLVGMFFFVNLFLGCALEPLDHGTSSSTPTATLCQSDEDCGAPGVCSEAGLCVGPQGEAGERGPMGPRGPAGQNGEDGQSCTVAPHPSGEAQCVLISCGESRRELCAPAGRDGRDGQDGVDGQDGTSCTVETLASGEHFMLCSDGTSATWQDGERGPMGPQGSAGQDGADGSNGQNGADGRDGVDGQDGRDGANAAPCSVRNNGNGTATMTCPNGSSVTWQTAVPAPAPECVRASDCTNGGSFCDGTTLVNDIPSCIAGTCHYQVVWQENAAECRVVGDECVRNFDCGVVQPYCDGTTLLTEQGTCDSGFCVYNTGAVTNSPLCPTPPTDPWFVEIEVRDVRPTIPAGSSVQVHLYHNDPHRGESADTYAFAPHTFRLSQLEACEWGVEIAARSLPNPSTGPWWGCDAGTPSKRNLQIRINGVVMSHNFQPHDHSCSGAGEGNLYYSPAALGCPAW